MQRGGGDQRSLKKTKGKRGRTMYREAESGCLRPDLDGGGRRRGEKFEKVVNSPERLIKGLERIPGPSGKSFLQKNPQAKKNLCEKRDTQEGE